MQTLPPSCLTSMGLPLFPTPKHASHLRQVLAHHLRKPGRVLAFLDIVLRRRKRLGERRRGLWLGRLAARCKVQQRTLWRSGGSGCSTRAQTSLQAPNANQRPPSAAGHTQAPCRPCIPPPLNSSPTAPAPPFALLLLLLSPSPSLPPSPHALAKPSDPSAPLLCPPPNLPLPARRNSRCPCPSSPAALLSPAPHSPVRLPPTPPLPPF